MTKIHLGCGTVYLEGYENLDIGGKFVDEVESNPNLTTLDKYFKYPLGSPRREIIKDGHLNFLVPWEGYEDNSVDEIAAISVIEHFTKKEAQFIVSEIKRVLKPSGKLIMDFPDIKQQVLSFIDVDPEWCYELIFCNHKNKYSVHKWGYTFETFKELLGDGWKSIIKKRIVWHEYPMIGIEAQKD